MNVYCLRCVGPTVTCRGVDVFSMPIRKIPHSVTGLPLVPRLLARALTHTHRPCFHTSDTMQPTLFEMGLAASVAVAFMAALSATPAYNPRT